MKNRQCDLFVVSCHIEMWRISVTDVAEKLTKQGADGKLFK